MDSSFDRARDLFLDGVAHYGAGRLQAADTAFTAALALVPGRASVLTNLGAVRLKLGRAQEAVELLQQALAVAKPKAIYTTVLVTGRGDDFLELDDIPLESRLMPRNLAKVHRAFPYVVTCGTEIDDFGRSLDDMVQVWWLDTIKELILAQANTYLDKHFTEVVGLGQFSVMNPGSLPDWPLSEQPKLFALIGDVEGLIGVQLTDSCLMLPTKTLSGLAFQSDEDYQECRLCNRKACTGRRVAFDAGEFERLMGK